jgi:mono/diheme cytochrome c family protein
MKPLLTLCAAALLPVLTRAVEPVDYVRDVKPLLAKHCIACHGPDKQRSGLRLDTAASALKGGNSGPAIVPGKSGDSRLLIAVSGGTDDVTAMPPKDKPPLSKEEIAVLRAWVDAGAAAPANEAAAKLSSPAGQHWSFRPIARPAEPGVKNATWVRNPVDRFVLARLEKEKLAPSPEADRATLLRRVSLDLTGLPPSPQEVIDFLKDERPDAYERVVDRLLASPHYGERWGRHWLDLARYADSNGYSIDAPRSIWTYRDWVINALNKDMPFDQFTVEQLAGDLLPNATNEQLIATGFHRNTQINQEGGIDLEQFRVESIVDRVNTTGSAFLGLTIGCCQCHDHKFDPLSQREYYQLFAFFNSVDEPTLELPTPEQKRKRADVQARIAELEKRLKALDATTPEKLAAWEGSLTPEAKAMLPEKIQAILAIAVNGRTPGQEQALITAYQNVAQTGPAVAVLGDPNPLTRAANLLSASLRQALAKDIARLKKEMPAITTTLIVRERKTLRTTNIHLGGDFLRKGAVVVPDVPSVLPPLGRTPGETTGVPNRLDFARWVVRPNNPLTARVMVNRFWQSYFGTGLVETENDFGTQGTPPTHPELLDWLADEFVARGWGMKAMHRLIVTSATYRQSSKSRPELASVDARNRLLARQSRLRLEAEVVRDVALASSGLLNPAVGGPSVHPPQPQGVYNFTQVPKEWATSTGPDRYRRGIYTFLWRSAPHPGLTVFDAPDATFSCTRRNRSNTPLQALTLLNDQGFFEFAQALAGRVLKEGKPDDAECLRYAFRLCLARESTAREYEALSRLLAKERERFAASPKEAKALCPAELPTDADRARYAAWVMVGRVLLNLDEFITRE